MTETAQAILTGYDSKKIDSSVKMLKSHSEKFNIKVTEGPKTIKAKSHLWGCDEKDVREGCLLLEGSMDDLRSILDVKTEDGIYLQLLLK